MYVITFKRVWKTPKEYGKLQKSMLKFREPYDTILYNILPTDKAFYAHTEMVKVLVEIYFRI